MLPALVPDMTYEGMEVADGRMPGWRGSRSYEAAWIRSSSDRIRKALLDYCGQDTLALVKLLEKLRLFRQRQ